MIKVKIKNVLIKNFRSIKSAEFTIDNITALVGENNSGKTSVLRALNAVFNYSDEEPYFKNESHKYSPRANTYITIRIFDEHNSLGRKNFFKNGEIIVEFIYKYSNRKKSIVIKNSREIKLDDSKIDFMDELNKYLNYIYISTNRSDANTIWAEESLFKRLLVSYMNKHTERRDRLSSSVKKASNKIYENALKQLEIQLDKLHLQNKPIEYKLNFDNNIDYLSLLDKVNISISNNGDSFLIRDWGSGTKSLAIIAMHRALAQINGSSIILGIEEPEMNLHPQAQKRFIQSLKESIEDGNNEVQTLFTTHSTVLIDELQPEQVLLVKRVTDNIRNFHSEVHYLSKNFWEKSGISYSGYKNFYDIRNSEFYFSKYVIICESSIDEKVIRYLIQDSLSVELADVSIINLGGVKNLNYAIYLLRDLKIPFVTILDKDFFFDYKNDDLDSSRDNKGFPQYKNRFTTDPKKRKVINDFLKSRNIENAELHVNQYRLLWNDLSDDGFLVMKYSLEVDLILSQHACNVYRVLLNKTETDNIRKTLLCDCKKSIKNRENILHVLNTLEPREYPESYKKIKNFIIRDVKKHISNN